MMWLDGKFFRVVKKIIFYIELALWVFFGVPLFTYQVLKKVKCFERNFLHRLTDKKISTRWEFWVKRLRGKTEEMSRNTESIIESEYLASCFSPHFKNISLLPLLLLFFSELMVFSYRARRKRLEKEWPREKLYIYS